MPMQYAIFLGISKQAISLIVLETNETHKKRSFDVDDLR